MTSYRENPLPEEHPTTPPPVREQVHVTLWKNDELKVSVTVKREVVGVPVGNTVIVYVCPAATPALTVERLSFLIMDTPERAKIVVDTVSTLLVVDSVIYVLLGLTVALLVTVVPARELVTDAVMVKFTVLVVEKAPNVYEKLPVPEVVDVHAAPMQDHQIGLRPAGRLSATVTIPDGKLTGPGLVT